MSLLWIETFTQQDSYCCCVSKIEHAGWMNPSAYCLSLWSGEWPLTAALVEPFMQTKDNWQIPCRNDLLNQWIPCGSDKDYPVVLWSLLGLAINTPPEVLCTFVSYLTIMLWGGHWLLFHCCIMHLLYWSLSLFVVLILSSVCIYYSRNKGSKMVTWFLLWDRLSHINLCGLSSFLLSS